MTDRDHFAAAGGRGHNTQEPVAWLAHSDEWQMVSLFREHADAAAAENGAEVIPLTPFTLTDQERFVLREARDFYADVDDGRCNEIAAVLDGLLERTTNA
jgi:hypothetical protein